MSKLNELLEQLCPNGVEYWNIGDIAEVGTGSSNGNEAIDDGAYPFFVRSQTIKAKDDYEYDEEAIIIPGEDGIDGIFVFDVRGEQDVVAVEGFAKHEEVLFAAFGGVFSDGGRERFPERVFDVFERVDSEAVAIGGVDPVREDVDHGLSDVGAFGGDVFETAGEVA